MMMVSGHRTGYSYQGPELRQGGHRADDHVLAGKHSQDTSSHDTS